MPIIAVASALLFVTLVLLRDNLILARRVAELERALQRCGGRVTPADKAEARAVDRDVT